MATRWHVPLRRSGDDLQLTSDADENISGTHLESDPALHDRIPRRSSIGLRSSALGVIALFALGVMAPVQLNGDEASYVNGARALGLWARGLLGGAPFEGSVIDSVVQNGWFMPGISILLSPIFLLLGGDVPALGIRLCMLAANLALLWTIAGQVELRWGRRSECLFLAVPFVSPNYLLFLSTAWSELLALHGAILVLFWIHDRYFRTEPRTYRCALLEGGIAGFLVAALTYLRGLYPFYLAVIAAAALLRLASGKLTRERVTTCCASVLAATLAFALLIAPWSSAVSSRFGRALTVTSSSISNVAWKAEPSFIQEVREVTGVQVAFFALQEYVLLRAESNGVSYREAAADIEEEVLTGITWREHVSFFRRNVRAFFAVNDATPFMQRFFQLRCASNEGCLPPWLQGALSTWANLGWWTLIVVGAFVFVVPLRSRRVEEVYLAFLWKALFFGLAIHPYLVLAHTRYYAQFVPLVAMAVSIASSAPIRVLRPIDIAAPPRPRSLLNSAGQLLAMGFGAATAYLALS